MLDRGESNTLNPIAAIKLTNIAITTVPTSFSPLRLYYIISRMVVKFIFFIFFLFLFFKKQLDKNGKFGKSHISLHTTFLFLGIPSLAFAGAFNWNIIVPSVEVFGKKRTTEFAPVPTTHWLFAVVTFPTLFVYAFATHNNNGGLDFAIHLSSPLRHYYTISPADVKLFSWIFVFRNNLTIPPEMIEFSENRNGLLQPLEVLTAQYNL